MRTAITFVRYYRFFMNLKTYTMSQSVAEKPPIALFFNKSPGYCIKLLKTDSGLYRIDSPIMGFLDNTIDFFLARIRLTYRYGYCLVRAITLIDCSKINSHQLALPYLPVTGLAMGKSTSRA